MEFEKPSQAVIDAFDAVQPPPPVERRKMFGMPAWFVNGNMFAFVFGQAIVVRLPETERAKLVRAGGAPFGPMGRPMHEYISVPPAYHRERARLRTWIKKAQAFAESIPPRAPKAAKKPASAARPALPATRRS